MNEFKHPFDPSLKPVFSGDACLAALKYSQDGRELFYTLMHISEHYDAYPAAYQFIQRQLAESNGVYQENFSKTYQPDNIADVLHTLPCQPATVQSSTDTLNECLRQSEPVILTEPCWLQELSQAATSPIPLAVDLTAVYQKLTQGEKHKDLFRALLLSAGLELPALHSRQFAMQESISGCMFDLASAQLALTLFPRVFCPEILGFTVAYCQSPTLLKSFFPVQTHGGEATYEAARQRLLSSVVPDLIKIIDAYLCLFNGSSDRLWQRIQSGFGLYRWLMQRCVQHLRQRLETSLSPHQELTKLLQQKAPAAAGHHRKIKLAGRSLDDWFAASPFDSTGFLSELKKSPYIDRQNPANSPLLKLFEFNGPMFGVLNDAEKNSLRNWLVTEKAEKADEAPVIEQSPEKPPVIEDHAGSIIPYSRLDNRDLYYYLVNADVYPEVLTTARRKVLKVLRGAKLFSRLPFKPYRHQLFSDYIDALYQREVRAYQPLGDKPTLSKKAYLWGIEQFAPTILTDGCWLQNISRLTGHADAIGAILHRIYDDEAGNGKLEQNHPYIYRQLLNSVNISLPPIHSQAFSDYPGFIGSAFDIPVYLLSISKFPGAFLPELLGLNLAIELSGLGRVYLRLSEELKYWGINPAIVDVHISIDNVASGHAFLAKKAIQLYLDDIYAGFGDEAMQTHWRRIHTGYGSLQTASLGFKLALICRYLLNR